MPLSPQTEVRIHHAMFVCVYECACVDACMGCDVYVCGGEEGVCVYVHACYCVGEHVSVCAWVCVLVCVQVCVCVWGCTLALFVHFIR